MRSLPLPYYKSITAGVDFQGLRRALEELPRLFQAATLQKLDGYRRQVYAIETAHVDAPLLGCGPRPSKRQDAARRAEVVLCGPRMPLIQREILKRSQQAQVGVFHAMQQCATAPAHRTVA